MISREEQAYLVRAWNAADDATASREAQQMIAAEKARVHSAFAQLPIRVQFVDHDPYRSFEQMRDQVQSTGQMLVWTGASETPLWDPQTNWMARAVHDWDHIVRSCDFSMEGEAEAYRNAAACRPGLAPLYLSEVMLQAAIANYTGSFVPQKLVLAPEVVQRRARQMRGLPRNGVPGRSGLGGMDRSRLVALANDVSRESRRPGGPYLPAHPDRTQILNWLKWNDPNGTYTDADIANDAQFDEPIDEEFAWELLEQTLEDYTPSDPALRGVGNIPPVATELVWKTAGLLRVTTPAMAMVHLRAQGLDADEALVVVIAAEQLNHKVDDEYTGDYLARRRGGFDGVGAPGALKLGEAVFDVNGTASLAKMKLRAKNDGTLQGAIVSAAYHAKKQKQTMYVWNGNSYMHSVWHVATKPSLGRFENIGNAIFYVTPDLRLYRQPILR